MNFITDLAFILITAGITTIIFKALKQPLILGYIVAGFLVGPKLGLLHISDMETVHQWSEVGIIFLLFGLGLEFSYKKLLQVGLKATIMLSVIVVGMTMIGYAVGVAFGWSSTECLFLGSMLCMTSSTIVIKAFDELNLMKQPFAQTVFGTLVMEDILGVILMVLMSTMAAGQGVSGEEMVEAIGKLLFYIILWFVLGMFVLPSLLKWGRRHMNEEMLTVVSIGLCFLMVYLATEAGFSSALGAFIMGSLLSETIDSERIEKQVKNLQYLFGAVFFVSVGMMVDPQVIAVQWKPILVLTLVVLFLLPTFAFIGAILAKNSFDTSVKSAMSLAQAGEFGFIVASLGISLGVISETIYPIIVSVSVITTFTASYYIRFGEPLSRWLQAHLSARITQRLERWCTKTRKQESDWQQIKTMFITRFGIYSVLLIAVGLACVNFISPLIGQLLSSQSETTVRTISCITSFLALLPFEVGIVRTTPAYRQTLRAVWLSGKHHVPIICFVVARCLAVIVSIVWVAGSFFKTAIWVTILLVLLALAIFVLARRGILRFGWFEHHFLENIHEKETYEKSLIPLTSLINERMAGQDIGLRTLVVSSDSPYIGMQLKDIPIRSKYGVNVIKIIRGTKTLNIPQATEFLYPNDQVLVMGNQAQVEQFAQAIEERNTAISRERAENSANEVVLLSFVLSDDSQMVGKMLKETHIRNSGCMLIGVVRGGESIMNPKADTLLQSGDILYIVGEKDKADAMTK